MNQVELFKQKTHFSGALIECIQTQIFVEKSGYTYEPHEVKILVRLLPEAEREKLEISLSRNYTYTSTQWRELAPVWREKGEFLTTIEKNAMIKAVETAQDCTDLLSCFCFYGDLDKSYQNLVDKGLFKLAKSFNDWLGIYFTFKRKWAKIIPQLKNHSFLKESIFSLSGFSLSSINIASKSDQKLIAVIEEKLREADLSFLDWERVLAEVSYNNLNGVVESLACFAIEKLMALAKDYEDWSRVYDLLKDITGDFKLEYQKEIFDNKLMKMARTYDHWCWIYWEIDYEDKEKRKIIFEKIGQKAKNRSQLFFLINGHFDREYFEFIALNFASKAKSYYDWNLIYDYVPNDHDLKVIALQKMCELDSKNEFSEFISQDVKSEILLRFVQSLDKK